MFNLSVIEKFSLGNTEPEIKRSKNSSKEAKPELVRKIWLHSEEHGINESCLKFGLNTDQIRHYRQRAIERGLTHRSS
jgi:hypothetical protein